MESGTFRANPVYELVLLDRLSPAERTLVVADVPDDVLYGVLRPHPGSGLDTRSVSPDTALLFLTLAEPGRVPAFVRARLGDDTERTINRLVLDGVLEIEARGEFVCGAEASELVMTGRPAGAEGRIAELSEAALRYGQELQGLSESQLALRLYFYGRKPISPKLAREYPDAPAVAARLGVVVGGSAWAELEAGWVEVSPAPGAPVFWRQWRARSAALEAANYKLYVSPVPEELGPAVRAVAGSLPGTRGVVAFKVGRELPHICRPDKLVVYFDRLDDLQAGADRLREQLAGCPAHGVPFTAAITTDGLLSWGADPPSRSGGGGTSWRMWVTARLAEYLTYAREAAAGMLEPWQFALERLRLTGIDTDTWVPTSGMWPEALASG